MDPVGVIIRLFTRLCVHIGYMLGDGVASLIRKLIQILNRPRWQSSGEKRIAQTVQDETQRQAGCRRVVMEFVNGLGYIAREAMNREELAEKIDGGISPEELAAELHQRIAKIPGITLGLQHFQTADYEMKLPYSMRDRHMYIIGRSGSGKTNLIRSCLLQDIFYGCGVGVLAPEQELLTEEILPYIPDKRIDDVVYVNPADSNPISFNPFHLDYGEDIEQKFQDTLSIFKRVMGETGARMDAILRHTLYALLERPHTTLLDIGKLLDREDPTLRNEIVRTTDDDETRTFFRSTYPSMPKDAHLPIMNRLSPLIRPRVIRNLLCNPNYSFNFRAAMDEGKIILFNVSDGVLGEEASQIIGQFFVSKMQLAVMSRADTPRAKRHPFYLYLDEFQTFTGINEMGYSKMLSRARKYGMGLTLAHQHTGQIPQNLLRDIFGNVLTLITFSVSSEDATKLSREYIFETNGQVEAAPQTEFLRLKTGEAMVKIDKTVFRMSTFLLPSDYNEQRRDWIIDRSRQNYSQGGKWKPDIRPHEPRQLPPKKDEDDEDDTFDGGGIDPRRVF